MTIIRTPIRDFMALQDRMNRLFDSTLQREGGGEDLDTAAWTPPVDIYETKENIVVNVEVPGVTKEMFQVEMNDDILTIRGERPFEKDVDQEQYHRMERPYGKFRRSFVLGTPVRVDDITATYREGVLEVLLPKVEEVKPRKIEISG
jgi:HSP20 family protein